MIVMSNPMKARKQLQARLNRLNKEQKLRRKRILVLRELLEIELEASIVCGVEIANFNECIAAL